MKSLEKKFAGSEAKLENFSNTKLIVDNRSVSVFVPIKPNDKVYIPHFKRNHKENAYVSRLDKGKSSNVYAEVSKPKSKPNVREYKKSVFVPACHLCGVFGYIRQNCSLLRQEPKPMTGNPLGILMFLNLFSFVTFMVCLVTFVLTVIN